MLPDRVSNPGPLTYESGALPIALRGPAPVTVTFPCINSAWSPLLIHGFSPVNAWLLRVYGTAFLCRNSHYILYTGFVLRMDSCNVPNRSSFRYRQL